MNTTPINSSAASVCWKLSKKLEEDAVKMLNEGKRSLYIRLQHDSEVLEEAAQILEREIPTEQL